MPKTPDCDCCMFYAQEYQIVCAIYPPGIEDDSGLDFQPDRGLEGKHFVDFLGLQ